MRFVMECGPCDGDLVYAKELVDCLAENHPYAEMKVQFFTAETLAAHDSPRYDRTDDRLLSQRQMFQRQLDWDQWAEVASYARDRGVPFFASVFSEEAVDKALKMKMTTLKIASGDITNLSLIRYASQADEVIFSTGASTLPEVKAALQATIPARPLPLACHLAYPSSLDEAHLTRVTTLQNELGRPVGYSDHTPGTASVVPLTVLGAVLWEKHFTLRPSDEGDHTFAIGSTALGVARLRYLETLDLLGSGDLQPTPSELAARVGARRSLAARDHIRSGELLTAFNTTWLRPATGISFEDAHLVLDKASARWDISSGTTITADMVVNGRPNT